MGFVGSLKENADIDGEGQDQGLGGMIKRGEGNEEIGNEFDQDDLWPDVEIVEAVKKEMKLGQGIKVGGNAQGRIGAKVGSAITTTTSDSKSRSALNTKVPSKSTTSSNSKPIGKVSGSSRIDSSKPSTSTSTSVRKTIPNVTKTTSVKSTLNNNPINAKTSQPSSATDRKPQISKASSSSNKSRNNDSNNESKPSQPLVRSSNVNVGVVRKPLSTLKDSNIMKPKTQGQSDEGMKKVKRVINPELADKKIQNDDLNDWLKGNEKVGKGGMVEEEVLFEGF